MAGDVWRMVKIFGMFKVFDPSTPQGVQSDIYCAHHRSKAIGANDREGWGREVGTLTGAASHYQGLLFYLQWAHSQVSSLQHIGIIKSSAPCGNNIINRVLNRFSVWDLVKLPNEVGNYLLNLAVA